MWIFKSRHAKYISLGFVCACTGMMFVPPFHWIKDTILLLAVVLNWLNYVALCRELRKPKVIRAGTVMVQDRHGNYVPYERGSSVTPVGVVLLDIAPKNED